MHLDSCRFFQKHLRLLFQSLRPLCSSAGGPESIWKYLEAMVRSTRVSWRLVCGFWTDLSFADVGKHTDQFHHLHGYGYPASEQRNPDALHLYHHSSFKMPQSSQPTTSVGQGYPISGTQWQGYHLHEGDYGRFHAKCHHLQFHQQCHKDCWETIQSIGQTLPALLLNLDPLPAHLGDPPSASQWTFSSSQQNRWKLDDAGIMILP